MYDATTVLLYEYYRATGWNEQRAYAQLMTASSLLLDFPVPHGALLTHAAVSNPSLFSSARLLAVPLSGSLGYTHAATHAQFNAGCIQRASERMLSAIPFLQPDTLRTLRLAQRPPPREMLLHGNVHMPANLVEALAVMRLSPHWQCSASALSCAPRFPLVPLGRWIGVLPPPKPRQAPRALSGVPPGTTNMTLALQMQTEKTVAEYSYSVDDALWGVSVLRTLSSPASGAYGTLCAGAELFMSALERSAGVSMGLRYAMPHGCQWPVEAPQAALPSVATLTLNPIMGHVRTSYAAQVDPDLAVCARYDFNVFSYLSDLSFGLEYRLWTTEEDLVQDESPPRSLRETHGVWTPYVADKALSLREEHARAAPQPLAARSPAAEECAPLCHAPSLQGLLKWRMSASGVLALLWEGHWHRCLVSKLRI
ncbi:Mdm10p [Malassezia vespertilionis]|uniref:Mitochondrial distribution and morphology protein 10 n=1 Tax=Malassezia vespertilionis TaxID=2020962 RepID=A0A2N1JBN9_9BASI|nr:Mdm10p [Malassezia vespertilionis]